MKPRQRCECGGTSAQHTGDEGCWCPGCLQKPEDSRCQQLVPALVNAQRAPVGREHPQTAKAAAEHALPRSGTRRRELYDLIQKSSGGLTDDEIEQVMCLSHQTVSASRNSLMVDGLVYDTGVRRLTRYGHDAIVWQVRIPD